MNRSPLFAALLVSAFLAACGPAAVEPPPLLKPPPGAEPLTAGDAGSPAVDAGTPPPPPPTGLPCEVRQVLEAHCMGCHAGQTYVRHLTRRDDFLAEHVPGQSVGQFAISRMVPGAKSLMPPYGYTTQPTAAEVELLADWVGSGMPGGACGEATGH